MSSKLNLFVPGHDPSAPGRKLLDLPFGKFLEILRDRGRGEKADDLLIRATSALSPPLTEAQVLEMPVEVVTLALEICIGVKELEARSMSVKSRITELEGEGFMMLPGERNG